MITIKKGVYMESKCRMEKLTDDGTQAKFNELYTVRADTFTECEKRMHESVSQYSQGEFEVLTEAYARYGEIIFSDDDEETLFYRVKVDFITVDEKGKTKHSKTDFLVQGKSVESAKKNVDDALRESMMDWKIVSLSESAICEIVE